MTTKGDLKRLVKNWRMGFLVGLLVGLGIGYGITHAIYETKIQWPNDNVKKLYENLDKR